MDRSAKNAAKKMLMLDDAPIFRNAVHTPKPTHGPTMAMEKIFAPKVVIPPCARRSAWKSSTMLPMKAITGGLNSTAPKPVPVGCDDDPVTDGILMALSTNVNAPAAPSSRPVSGFSFNCFRTA